LLLRLGMDPNICDTGGHTPLYSVANECASKAVPEVVRMLVRAGADVNASGGITGAAPLHMAARRGFVEIAWAGAVRLRRGGGSPDRKGDTPLRRAINCRRDGTVRLLMERVAARERALVHPPW
jgi:ankyrin repeat protein